MNRGNLCGTRPVFMRRMAPKSRPGRSQDAHSSEEAGQCLWSEGARHAVPPSRVQPLNDS
ncbi:MAG: hypothetical protein JRG73_20985 [Deltaproteobacteria bacterium]|nr:hypothetical protein [Deltaproteobacteria bacterium]MBW2309401.1 hypothetical protein [Deltaproteobacteria bacterium]